MQAEIKFTWQLYTIIKDYILDKVKDYLGWYSFKELIWISHIIMPLTNDLQEITFNQNVSQLTRDPLHTDHIKGDEVYFPFWMNALNVYDLFEGD